MQVSPISPPDPSKPASPIIRRRLAPGPRGHVVFGSLPDLRRDPLQTMLDGWHRYGDVVRFRLGGSLQAHLLVHPRDVKQVLQDNHVGYQKDVRTMNELKETIGEGLLTSEGSLWLRQRRLAQPAFHRQRIAALGTVMTDCALAMLDRWKVYADIYEPFDVSAEMMHLTLEVVTKSLFGTEMTDDSTAIGQAVTVAIEHTMQRLQAYAALPMSLPFPGNYRFQRAKQELDEVVFRFISESRRSGRETGNLLSLLLHAQDDSSGQGMSDQQLRDEVMTLFLAGHETTALSLSWTFYLLSRYPEASRRLHAELADVLGGRPPTVDDLPHLPYTRMVIDESMRLYPPAWVVNRTPLKGDDVGGYWIPPGKLIWLSSYITHRHPDFWENPEGFDPERFSPEHSAGRPRYAYFPFGGGPRQCIGNGFALQEAQLILATVAQRYHLDLVPGHPIALHPLITLRPRYGIRMTLRPT